MIEFVIGLFIWVCTTLGVNPNSIEKPQVVVLEPVHMATLICGKPVVCENFKPAYYDGKTLYLLNGVDWHKRKLASVIVHELVHHIQIRKAPNKEWIAKHADLLEYQAMEVQKFYLSLIEI